MELWVLIELLFPSTGDREISIFYRRLEGCRFNAQDLEDGFSGTVRSIDRVPEVGKKRGNHFLAID